VSVHLRRLAAGVLVATAVAVLLAIAWTLLTARPSQVLSALVGDDAGYYLNIARNTCLGYGVSFDRVHPTNGFNPLLLWILVGAFHLLPHALPIVMCFRVGLLTGFLIELAGFAYFVRLVSHFMDGSVFRGDDRRLMLAACAVFYGLFVCTKNHYGMDAPLVLLIGNAYLDRVQRKGLTARGLAAGALDGALLGLLFLARVDSLPMIAAAFALIGLRSVRDRALASGLAVRMAAFALVISPYVVWASVQFGSVLPISARIKSSFPHLDLASSVNTMLHSSLTPLDLAGFLFSYLLSLAMTGMMVWRAARVGWRGVLRDGKAQVVALLSLYLAARFTFMMLFSRADVQGSYAILSHVYNVLMLLAGAETLARQVQSSPARSRIVAATAGGLALVSLLLLAGKLATVHSRWAQQARAGMGDDTSLAWAIHEHTTPRGVIFGGALGIAGFFADRSWINGDGVANNSEHQEAFVRGGLRDYLRRSRVTHVVFSTDPRRLRESRPIRLHAMGYVHGRSDSIEVDPRDAVLSMPLSRGPGSVIALARFHP
jgi:hypothetical protein